MTAEFTVTQPSFGTMDGEMNGSTSLEADNIKSLEKVLIFIFFSFSYTNYLKFMLPFLKCVYFIKPLFLQ